MQSIRSQIEDLREQLSQQVARHGSDDPFVEHLRWQIASLERQMRRSGSDAAAAGSPARRLRRSGDTPTPLA
jgi:hypothetical protein